MGGDTKFVVIWPLVRPLDSAIKFIDNSYENTGRRYFETVEDAIEFISKQPVEWQPHMVMQECY